MREEIGIGKTIEDAVANACEKLGVKPDSLNLSREVLEKPVRRLLFSTPAKVKVTVNDVMEKVQEAAADVTVKAQAVAAEVQDTAVSAAAEAAGKVAEAAAEVQEKLNSTPRRNHKDEDEPEEPLNIQDNPKLIAATDYLKTVFEAMGVKDTEFTAVKKGEATILRVSGKNMGVLIGRRGETMESLSYLASLVANRLEGDYLKLGLDVGGYRDKRESDLRQLAQRVGARVRKSGRSHAMDPMNPYERRIVHSAISEMEGVRSESTGEGRDRHVVIYSTDPEASNLPDGREHRGGSRRDGGRGGYGRGNGRGGHRGNRRDGGRGSYGRDGGCRSGYGRGNGGKRSSVPEREFSERLWDDTVPIAPKRTDRINDADGFALYGKIEL